MRWSELKIYYKLMIKWGKEWIIGKQRKIKKRNNQTNKKTACERLNFEIICNKWSIYFKEQVYKYFMEKEFCY